MGAELGYCAAVGTALGGCPAGVSSISSFPDLSGAIGRTVMSAPFLPAPARWRTGAVGGGNFSPQKP